MFKKAFFLFVPLFMYGTAQAEFRPDRQHDFSAVCPSGQTLYYKIDTVLSESGMPTVQLWDPNACYWLELPIVDHFNYYPQLQGALIIPDTVIHDGVQYLVTGGLDALMDWSNNSYSTNGITSLSIPKHFLLEHFHNAYSETYFPSCTTLYYNYTGFPIEVHQGSSDMGMVISDYSYINVESVFPVLKNIYFGEDVEHINIRFNHHDSLRAVYYYADSCDDRWDNPTSPIFYDCPNLDTVVFGNNVKVIQQSLFDNCALRKVLIPDSVRTIGRTTFIRCHQLTDVALGGNVDSIRAGAFKSSPIRNIAFPNSIKYVGSAAFAGHNMKRLVLPESVTYICESAFVTDSAGFDTITMLGYIPPQMETIDTVMWGLTVSGDAFAYSMVGSIEGEYYNESQGVNYDSILLEVPCIAWINYRATNWNRFNNVRKVGCYTVVTLCDTTKGSICGDGDYQYGDTVSLYAAPRYGYVFNGWADSVTDNPRYYVVIGDTTMEAIFSLPTNTVDTTYITQIDTVTNTVYDTTVVYSIDTLWLHDTIFIYDTIYVGVDDVETISAKIYTSSGQIVVDGAEGDAVRLYDINGRTLAVKQDVYSSLHFDVPSSGTYLVKIGNLPARKIVVIRSGK